MKLREELFQTMAGVESRMRDAQQQALLELSGAFERRIGELVEENEDLKATVERLKRADARVLREQADFEAEVIASVSSKVTLEVQKQLGKNSHEGGREGGREVVEEESKKIARRQMLSSAGTFVGTMLAAALLVFYEDCRRHPEPEPKAEPAAPAPSPRGPGYGGRW